MAREGNLSGRPLTFTLRFHAARPTMHGLETHLLSMHRVIEDFAPETVIIDPISNLTAIGTLKDIKLMFLRILNHLKEKTSHNPVHEPDIGRF